LTDADKLEALRRLDQFRQWRSLDEKRYCLVCGKIIIGRQIHVAGGTRGNGALRLSCPTERCNSIPMDWVLPTDEIIAKVEMMVAEERKAAELPPTHHMEWRTSSSHERTQRHRIAIAQVRLPFQTQLLNAVSATSAGLSPGPGPQSALRITRHLSPLLQTEKRRCA
jgi:hypothetical protein